MSKKNGCALLEQERTQTKEINKSIPVQTDPVKTCPLRALRLEKGIPGKEIVETIQAIYPKYDKTIQSKAERPEEYGLDLRQDALQALYRRFAPERMEVKTQSVFPEPRKGSTIRAAPIVTDQAEPSGERKDKHRFAHKVQCRLPDDHFDLLQRSIREDGYDTVQDWLTEFIRRYLQSKGAI